MTGRQGQEANDCPLSEFTTFIGGDNFLRRDLSLRAARAAGPANYISTELPITRVKRPASLITPTRLNAGNETSVLSGWPVFVDPLKI